MIISFPLINKLTLINPIVISNQYVLPFEDRRNRPTLGMNIIFNTIHSKWKIVKIYKFSVV